jgi:hypothetical protein
MESERIDGPNMVHLTDILSMTFEGVSLLLRGWRRVEILHGDSNFNRSSGVSYLQSCE